MRAHNYILIVFLALCLNAQTPLTANGTTTIIKSIQHSGFGSFSKGTLGNSGANLYVSRNGRVQVINKWDINSDGYNDVLISGSHTHYAMSDALIYWNGENGFTSLVPPMREEVPLAQLAFSLMDQKTNLTRLPTQGGGKSLVMDLNLDGYPDIVFCNYIHNWPGIRKAQIYWGGKDGYGTSRMTTLPTNWASDVAAADLNGDGYPDLVFANQRIEPNQEKISPNTPFGSFVYWGGSNGFDESRRTTLSTGVAYDVAVGDVNGDGYPDVAFLNADRPGKELQIFLGGLFGYSDDRCINVPIASPKSIKAADINGDTLADLVITTGQEDKDAPNPKLKYITYILKGSIDGIDEKRSDRILGYAGVDSCIGDFNRDGHIDIAVAASPKSFVFWGSRDGFVVNQNMSLPVIGATAVAAGDLNSDGYDDLVFANSRDDNTYDVPSYIYWGSSTGFADYMRSDIQGFDAVGVNIMDMNGDNKKDILLINQISGILIGPVKTDIFWGNPHAYYSTSSMTSLPTLYGYDTAIADINDDGWNDLVQTNTSGGKAYLFPGSKEGISAQHRVDIPVGYSISVSTADLNRDGFLDIVFATDNACVFWGSSKGFSESKLTKLTLKEKTGEHSAVADLNHDGFLDLVFANEYIGVLQIFWGSKSGYSESNSWAQKVRPGKVELADLNSDDLLDFVFCGYFDSATGSYNTKTCIFYGTKDGTPSPEPAFELESFGAEETSIGDLNNDGYLDLVISSYKSDKIRSIPLFIYWGDKNGYSQSNRTELPAKSSSGNQILDLNHDGYSDIVVQNHVSDEGAHTQSSYIYWNSPQGFDAKRKTELPSFGTHYSMTVDMGNLYTRTLEEEYISTPVKLPTKLRASRLTWQGTEPKFTKLKFQIRSARSVKELDTARWGGPTGEWSYYETSGEELSRLLTSDRWMQYRTVFTSSYGGEWPILTSVDIGLSTIE